MTVSKALENSAKAFSSKYACSFDFITFKSKVEEFTFLRPNNGWIDAYKAIFDRMYKNTLEKAAVGAVDNIDGEAMLDDFEYTLIRPYVNEIGTDIKHKPYVGMDRMARLEYLERLTVEAPSNLVDLYTSRYERGELSIRKIRSRARQIFNSTSADNAKYVEVAGYIHALECVNGTRSAIWRVFHPFKNNAERKNAALIKSRLSDILVGDDALYSQITDFAYETFDGHKRANENLARSMARASEELDRKQRMTDALKGSHCE